MKTFALILLMACLGTEANAQEKAAGQFSIGTRNTISLFNDDDAAGLGIGAQFRLRFSNRLNSEWFVDYISSRNKGITYRNDYHIGWSLMYYPGRTTDFSKLLQPYLLAGHCFDLSRVTAENNKANSASRLSMATQAGAGTHINFSRKFNCSLSTQYMLHFGKGLVTEMVNNEPVIQKQAYSTPHGHLLTTVSFSYLIGKI